MADNRKLTVPIDAKLFDNSENNVDMLEFHRTALANQKYKKEYYELSKKEKQEIEAQVKLQERKIQNYQKQQKYEKASLETQLKIAKANKESLEKTLENLDATLELAESEEEIKGLLSERAVISGKLNTFKLAEANLNSNILALEKETKKVHYENATFEEKQALKKEAHNEKIKKQKEYQEKLEKKIAEANLKGDKATAQSAQRALDELKRRQQKEKGIFGTGNIVDAFKGDINSESLSGFGRGILQHIGSGSGLGKAISSAFSESMPALSSALGPVVSILSTIANIAGKINKTLDKGVTEAAEMQNTYLASINARVQGGTDSYQKYMKYMQDNLSLNASGSNVGSAFVSQKKLLENINKLVQEGVGFNVEERAMLMTLSDKMVTTFDVLNPTLKRLARIQQADVTSSQLGYEALLTRFLNSYFQDTSYLSDVYDSVAGTLLDASSQLTAQASTEFNYAVQKWLASLYSVGMSESGVSKIAQGISYLSTGNIEAFNSDDALRTLFASAAGGSYSSILTGGLNAATVNDLLNNIVRYLQSIAGDTNQVTKRAMAGVFGGFDLSDIRAITNLDASMINTINNSMPTYNDSLKEVVNQLDAITRIDMTGDTLNADYRASLPAIYDTLFDNLIFGYGVGKVKDASAYADWKLQDTLASQGGLLGTIGEVSKTVTAIWDSIFGDKENTSMWDVFSNMWKTLIEGESRSKDWRDQFVTSSFYQTIKSEGLLTRGVASDYQSLLKEGTATGISAMSRYGVSQAGMADLSTTSSATASRTTTTGTQQTKDITALYAELFERQTTAMKVSLSNIDVNAASTLSNIILNNAPQSMKISGVNDSVLDALSATMHVDTIDDINNKLSDTLEVSISDNFLNEINSGLNYARGI